MSFDIVRAWKDEEYRLSLSDEERLSLPANPVGEIELTDADLEAVYGGGSRHCNISGCISGCSGCFGGSFCPGVSNCSHCY